MLSFVILVAILDSLNEQILISIYFLSVKRAVAHILLLSASIFIINMVVGLLLVFGLGTAIADFFAEPHIADYILEIIVGLALLIVGIMIKYIPKKTQLDSSNEVSLMKGVVIGTVLAIANAPMAFPYFAVIAKLISARASFSTSIWYLLLYNVFYILPNLIVIGLFLINREKIISFFGRYKASLEKWLFYIIKVFLILLGTLLVLDVLVYIFTGSSLI